MILADKIIRLRKREGWSQEELAERMDVSRQAVSKWESAQSTPDLDRILRLCELFGVSTDYLLRDEQGAEDSTPSPAGIERRRVSMDDAARYIAWRRRAAWLIAAAAFLCIISPITLIVLAGFEELPGGALPDAVVGGVGISAIFVFVLCAVPMFISCGFGSEDFAFLDEGHPFELEHGVRGFIKERRAEFRHTYAVCSIVATCICIFSPVPLILSGFLEDDFLSVMMCAVLIFLCAVAVFIFIAVGVRKACFDKMLGEGDYSAESRQGRGLRESVGFAYWGTLSAAYLVLSFLSGRWDLTWIVFVVGAVLFPLAMHICDRISEKSAEK